MVDSGFGTHSRSKKYIMSAQPCAKSTNVSRSLVSDPKMSHGMRVPTKTDANVNANSGGRAFKCARNGNTAAKRSVHPRNHAIVLNAFLGSTTCVSERIALPNP